MKANKEIKKKVVKRIVIEIDPDKHADIKIAAAKLGVSIKDLVDEAIRDRLEKEINK